MSLISEWTIPIIFNKAGEVIWTPREDQRLFNSYKKIPKKKMMLLFPDRTWMAIRQRAITLGVPRKGTRYTPSEDQLLETLYYDTDFTYRQMTRFFKFRTPNSLKTRMVSLRKRGRPSQPSTSTSICIIHIPDQDSVDGVDKIIVTRASWT